MNPDLLAQLRDIHAAPAAAWWPPAPGWWILALCLLVALVWLASRMLTALRVRRRRRNMLTWVDRLDANVDPNADPHVYLSTLNRIFKLVALRAFPGEHCAAMAGPQWVDFLHGRMKQECSFESLRVLASGPYDPAPQFDPAVISGLARQWISRYG